mmetsp:Transcript_11617/g.17641  ORF Transcript_11617/g.17641 Transcript_11617/m.17641 type:complete len:97 (-) Transcript_11617:181-471(-)
MQMTSVVGTPHLVRLVSYRISATIFLSFDGQPTSYPSLGPVIRRLLTETFPTKGGGNCKQMIGITLSLVLLFSALVVATCLLNLCDDVYLYILYRV